MCCQRNPFYSTMLLYTYISRFSVTPHYIKSGRVAATNAVPQPFLIAVSTSLTNGPRLLSQAKVGTHSAFRERSHTTAHTPKEGGVSDGAAITTLDTYCTFTNIPGPGIRTAYFAAFGSWLDVLSKNAESLRNSDALMRVAVPRRRGPAGLRCSVCNLVMLLFFHSARRAFHTCKRGCGITTLGVLRVLSKRWAAACQNSSFAVF